MERIGWLKNYYEVINVDFWIIMFGIDQLTHMSNKHKQIPIVKKPSRMLPLVKKIPFEDTVQRSLTIRTIGTNRKLLSPLVYHL